MARKARKNIVGNYFHVMVQGINKEFIFEKEEEKQEYLQLMKKIKNMVDVEILAYAIMGNHVHILFYAKEINNVSKYMHKLNTAYGIYYNKKYKRVGTVFRDRFKTQEILDRKHLIACFVYIHNNPVKAKLVKNFGDYKFSSYNEYIYKHYITNNDAAVHIFGTTEKSQYLGSFYNLHMKKYIENIEDTESDRIKPKELYFKLLRANMNDEQIINYLYNEYKYSQNSISECMNISRAIVRTVLSKRK